jgi:hypothetical protein
LSKLFDALTDFGFGVGVGDGDGLAVVGAAAGEEDAASAAGLSSPHPKRISTDAASPRVTATLTGEEGTGEGYKVNP